MPQRFELNTLWSLVHCIHPQYRIFSSAWGYLLAYQQTPPRLFATSLHHTSRMSLVKSCYLRQNPWIVINLVPRDWYKCHFPSNLHQSLSLSRTDFIISLSFVWIYFCRIPLTLWRGSLQFDDEIFHTQPSFLHSALLFCLHFKLWTICYGGHREGFINTKIMEWNKIWMNNS